MILKDKESLEANLDVARNLVQLILPPVTQLLGKLSDVYFEYHSVYVGLTC